jgi:hypothetical protein
MYVRFQMIEWDPFLKLFDAVRMSMLFSYWEVQQKARAHTSTITQEEFVELRRRFANGESYEERRSLTDKIFLHKEYFSPRRSGGWTIVVDGDYVIEYREASNELRISWPDDGSTFPIVSMLQAMARLSMETVIPRTLPVFHAYVTTNKRLMPRDEEVCEACEVTIDDRLEVEEELLPFAQRTAMMLMEANPRDFGLSLYSIVSRSTR